MVVFYDMCKFCCKVLNIGDCKLVNEFSIFFIIGDVIMLVFGLLCNEFIGFCDLWYICIFEDFNDVIDRLKDVFSF